MRFFPLVNVQPKLGQATEFPILSDQVIARACGAVNDFNKWKDWADTPTGDRYMRDAIADVQTAINTVPPGLRRGAAQEIQKYCDNAADVIGFLQFPGPGNIPAVPPSQTQVASIDRLRQPEPPPPNPNPPVATGQPGPGRGAFRGQSYPDVISMDKPPYTPPPTEEPTFTGSEPEPVPTPVPPPPAPAPQRPAVASEGNGCWYVIGQGYTWGARPSGGESTGLNQQDCQNIQARYQEVRNPVPTGAQASTVSNVQNQEEATATNAAGLTPTNASRPEECLPPNFWDGRRCRGSVASIPNLPGGFGGESPSAGIGPGDLPSGGSEGLQAFGMTGSKRRFRVVNL
jgi:hypothetical protein